MALLPSRSECRFKPLFFCCIPRNLTRTSITSGAPAAWAGREDLEVLLGNAPSEENEARGTVSTQLPDDDTEVIGIAAPGE